MVFLIYADVENLRSILYDFDAEFELEIEKKCLLLVSIVSRFFGWFDFNLANIYEKDGFFFIKNA